MKKYILFTLGLVIGTVLFTAPNLYAQFKSFSSNQVGNDVTSGDILQTDGTNSSWVATSTLGLLGDITGESFLDLSDTISSYTSDRVLYTDGSSVIDSGNLTFDGTELTTSELVVSGQTTFNNQSFGDFIIAGSNPSFTLSDTDGTNDDLRFRNGAGDLIIENGADGSPTTDRMRIALDGDISFNNNSGGFGFVWDATNERVGIDELSPDETLHVGGNAKIDDDLRVDTDGLFVDSANNRVGLGTTTPQARLHVQRLSGASAPLIPSVSGAISMILAGSSNQNGANGMLFLSGNNADAFMYFGDSDFERRGQLVYANSDDSFRIVVNNNEAIRINNVRDVGIGTSTPTAKLHVDGDVRFSDFGAGTLETDADGNLSVSSDENLKTNITNFTRGFDDIENVQPISFNWNQSSGMDTSGTYTGFSAQNVQANIPEAVGANANGTLTLSERAIMATLVNAVKEQQVEINLLKAQVELLQNPI